MPAFWHWFVAAGTVLFVLWCAWLIAWSAKQGPQNVADDQVVGHKWDGDLQEWNNPAPKWWLYLYFITIAWAVGYLIVFPGLGAWNGTLGWSQQRQYESEMQAAAARYEPIYEKFAAMDFVKLSQHPDANKLGKSLYASYCTTCHGSDARGATGYPNLSDDDWLWGNSEAALTYTLKNGRNGVMPVLTPALGGEQGVRNMVRYVQKSQRPGPAGCRRDERAADVCRTLQRLPQRRWQRQPGARRAEPDGRHLVVRLFGRRGLRDACQWPQQHDAGARRSARRKSHQDPGSVRLQPSRSSD